MENNIICIGDGSRTEYLTKENYSYTIFFFFKHLKVKIHLCHNNIIEY